MNMSEISQPMGASLCFCYSLCAAAFVSVPLELLLEIHLILLISSFYYCSLYVLFCFPGL